MTTVLEVQDLTKQYKTVRALDGISLRLEENTIYGMLGRNGAGKTTLMSLITAQCFANSGTIRVFGEDPYENAPTLSRMCFVRESQKYPDNATATHALGVARMFFPNWSQEFAGRLIEEFHLPMKTQIKKLSRGQLSAVGVIIGLAARAEITFFDEPYLGLDAVARQTFYDHLLADYIEHPRTIILSSHLIDEIANLIEHVILIDQGKILLNETADESRSRCFNLVGPRGAVEAFVEGREVIHTNALGQVLSATVVGHLTDAERTRLSGANIDFAPVSLQQMVVRVTQHASQTNASSEGTLR